MHLQNFCQDFFHLFPLYDTVDEAMFQKKFGLLESFRKFLSDRLFDDARSGKPDQRFWLRKDDISSMAKLAVTPPVVGFVKTEI